MSELTNILVQQIARFGPISVAEYMTQCLLHPKHGYYSTRNPLGEFGDFITAPEISQMFGELIGLWLAQNWVDQGKVGNFSLVELGPGKGTLMKDILRATKKIPEFQEAMEITLVEASPNLRKVQEESLKEFDIKWLNNVSDLPNKPLFLVANEFFDCLPIHQFAKTETGWQEQMIGAEDGKLGFVVGKLRPELKFPKDQDFAEISPASVSIMAEIDRLIGEKGGAALIIDYGNWGNSHDTLQAIKSHNKINPLEEAGQADITAHVDFKALGKALTICKSSPPCTQGAFLERLGITQRAQILAQSLAGKELETHIAAHRRLTHPDEMGSLFKVMAVTPKNMNTPLGFE